MDNPFSDKALFAKGLWALGLPALIDRKGENINLVVSEKDRTIMLIKALKNQRGPLGFTAWSIVSHIDFLFHNIVSY